MTSPALVDLWHEVINLPPRERIVEVARLMTGTPYDYGNKTARPIDGIIGNVGNKIDCSGFVRNVLDQAFPAYALAARDDLNAAQFQVDELFVDTTSPLPGDIVCWEGHVGIVYNNITGLFIGSQTSTGVRVASYKTGYWATTRSVVKYRKWKNL